MATDEVATTPPEGGSDPSVTVVHRFGKPLPTDPATLSDAIGLLLREALARRGWMIAPIGLYVVMLRLLEVEPAQPALSPVLGVAVAAFLVVDGLALWLGSRQSRMGMAALFAAVVMLCLDPTAGEVGALDLAPSHFLPFTALLLYVVVPHRYDRVAAVVTSLLAVALFSLRMSDSLWPEDLALRTWAPWTAAAMASCGVLFAARTRSLTLSVGALVVPAATDAWVASLHTGLPLFKALLVLHLLGLAARSTSARGRDALGGFAAALHRRLPTAAILLPFLMVICLGVIATGAATGGSARDPMVLRQVELGAALVSASMLVVIVALVLLPAAGDTSARRLTALPLATAGLFCGWVFSVIQWVVDWDQFLVEVTPPVLLELASFLAPVVVGLGLARWVRRASSLALGLLLGGTVWLEASAADWVPKWVDTVLPETLIAGVALLMTWGAATRASRASLHAFCGLGVALALALTTGWDSWTSRPPPYGTEVSEVIYGLIGDFAVEAIGLGLAVVLFVDCVRLARAVFTTCPVPEWHPVRADFAPTKEGA